MRTAFVIEEPDLLAEGIAFDEQSRSLFVGSEYRGKILRLAPGGQPTVFASGLASVLGLRVDRAHGRLWAATNGEAAAQIEPALKGRSSLVALDPATGAVVARATVVGKHLLNDVAVGPDGTAYVTDSEAGAVLRLAPGASELASMTTGSAMPYPNGITWSGGRLYVADGRGLFRLDEQGGLHPLGHAPEVELRGIDGLYACGAGLLGIQNGRKPWSVLRFELDPVADRVTAVRVVDAGSLPSPTTAAFDGMALLAVANSDVDDLGEQGLAPGSRPRTTIVRFEGVCPPRP